MSAPKQSQKYRRSGMIRDAGSSPWPPSSQSWKDPQKDIEAAGVSGMAAGALSEDSGVEAETSGDRGRDSEEEVETSEDSDQEVATKVTGPQTKARSGVLVKHLVSEWKPEGTCSHPSVDLRACPAVKAPPVLPFLIISQPPLPCRDRLLNCPTTHHKLHFGKGWEFNASFFNILPRFTK